PERVQPMPTRVSARIHSSTEGTHDGVGTCLLPTRRVHHWRDGPANLADQPLVGEAVRLSALSSGASCARGSGANAACPGSSQGGRTLSVRCRRHLGPVAIFMDMALSPRCSA